MPLGTTASAAADPWPAEGLEQVPACPVCGAEERERLYDDLRDRLFATPDSWELWQCDGCSSAYLDPRPTAGTVARAYERYMTHGPPAPPPTPSGSLARARQAALNGHLNRRYGYRLEPSARLGGAVVPLMPRMGALVDRFVRHLHFEAPTPRLLDFGCANGEFMLRMQSLGWEVHGIDFDPQSVERARAAGLDARVGSLVDLAPAEQRYDAITLGHVVEHLHDPGAELRRARELLRPGGMIWLATPNVEAIGHRRFGASWLALDAPRHLVLFNADSLGDLLRRSGFARIERLRPGPDARSLFRPSLAIAQGLAPLGTAPVESSPPLPPAWQARARWAELRSWLRPGNAEELIMAAWAPA
jgi:2-polyprenyl-3-methyl-5-hydroxy-6-metoxy-1,4-benzoquinol methylase